VAHWNGAVWTTLSNRTLPPDSELAAVVLFPGGAWAVGEKGMAEHGRVFFPLLVRVTGTTVRHVPIPRTDYGSALEDVAATSATDAWRSASPFGSADLALERHGVDARAAARRDGARHIVGR